MTTFRTMRGRVEQAKSLYSVTDTVEKYTGISIPPNRRIVCPMPHHVHKEIPSPSMMVFDSYFKCHGSCGASGDVIDFVGFMKNGANYRKNDPKQTDQALDELRCAVVQRAPEIRITVPKPFLRLSLVDEMHAALKQSALAQEYLKFRGIDGLEDEFRLGYKTKTEHDGSIGHYLAMPALEFGQCVSIKYRRIDTAYGSDAERDKHRRFDSEWGSKLGTFNLDNAVFSTGIVAVVEAEITVMRLHKLGITAIASTHGAKAIDPKLTNYLQLAKVVIIGDNDDNGAGESGALRRKSVLCHGTITYPPIQFKDLDDYLSSGGLASEIIK